MKGVKKNMKTEDKELCQKCGGRCCLTTSGFYAPEDFKEISINHFLELYKEGKIMFSFVRPDDYSQGLSGWLVRPAQVNTPGIQFDFLKDNSPCVNLQKDGCSIKDYYRRPRGCKLLLPMKFPDHTFGEDCIAMYGISEALNEWEIFKSILEATTLHILAEERMKNEEISFNHDVCQKCGGKCCQRYGCAFAPGDFKNLSFESLKKLLDKGFVSIAPISGIQSGLQNGILTLKVRNLGSQVCETEGDILRPCILWDSKIGCPFDDDNRPYGGKCLRATPDVGCLYGYSYKQRAEDWLPYQETLKKLWYYFKEKEIPFSGII